MKTCVLISFVILTVVALAQPVLAVGPEASDPCLVLWLKADDLAGTLNPGDSVNQWVDNSTWGTIFAPEAGWDEAPIFAEAIVPGNPNPVPVVRFTVTDESLASVPFGGASTNGNPGAQDKLYQSNNLAPNPDPLNMGAGQPMTLIVLMNNFDASDNDSGTYHPFVAKRGTGSCVWQLGAERDGDARADQLINVTYASPVVTYAGEPYQLGGVWSTLAMSFDADNNVSFWIDPTDGDGVNLELTSNSPVGVPGRNPSTAEPAGIAGHSQSCCGRNERMQGDFAEIIIYRKELSQAERDDISAYLTAKYFPLCQETAPAVEDVLDTADPDLRLWLKADDLAGTINDGDAVSSWTDASSYGTVVAPRDADEVPHYAELTVGDLQVSAIKFDVDGDCLADPCIPDSLLPTRDRLYQTNNLAPNPDPLDIGDGEDLTTFVVWQPIEIEAGLGYQTIFSKRSDSSSDYQLGITPYERLFDVNYSTRSYNPKTVYENSVPVAYNTWHVSSLEILDSPSIDPNEIVTIYDNGSGSRLIKMANTASHFIDMRNVTVPEPFAIGANSQTGTPGNCENFSGYVCELIIFGRKLSCGEKQAVEAYLNQKYLPLLCGDAGLDLIEGDINRDCYVNLEDFAIVARSWLRCNHPEDAGCEPNPAP